MSLILLCKEYIGFVIVLLDGAPVATLCKAIIEAPIFNFSFVFYTIVGCL